MTIEIRNTRDLSSDNLKLKVLLIGPSRVGKTSWAATAPNPGFAACETGHGSGLSSIMDSGVAFFEPKSLGDIDALASGHVFADKETIVVDSLSAMTRSIIKDYAVKMGRRGPDTPQRKEGIPEQFDYMAMAEITRRVLEAIIGLDKHIIVTALQKTKSDKDTQAPIAIGPDLPGLMFDVAPSMFDQVFYISLKKAFTDPKDARTAYISRVIDTQPDGLKVGGVRNNNAGAPILPKEIIFNNKTLEGGFGDIYAKLTAKKV
jgi:hypothetical protein